MAKSSILDVRYERQICNSSRQDRDTKIYSRFGIEINLFNYVQLLHYNTVLFRCFRSQQSKRIKLYERFFPVKKKNPVYKVLVLYLEKNEQAIGFAVYVKEKKTFTEFYRNVYYKTNTATKIRRFFCCAFARGYFTSQNRVFG